MAESCRQMWKRFKSGLKEDGHDLKRFKEDFGPTLDKIEDLADELEKKRAQLKDLVHDGLRVADKYNDTINEMIRECGRDKDRADSLKDLRGVLALLQAWLEATEKKHLK